MWSINKPIDLHVVGWTGWAYHGDWGLPFVLHYTDHCGGYSIITLLASWAFCDNLGSTWANLYFDGTCWEFRTGNVPSNY